MRASVAGWIFILLGVAASIATVVLVFASLGRSLGPPFEPLDALFGVAYWTFILVGALILAHCASRPVGVSLAP